MKNNHTTIKGFNVELELELSAEPTIHCWVWKGDYCGSLAKLSETGTLENNSDMELEVPSLIIDEIEDWADANGY